MHLTNLKSTVYYAPYIEALISREYNFKIKIG